LSQPTVRASASRYCSASLRWPSTSEEDAEIHGTELVPRAFRLRRHFEHSTVMQSSNISM
jgi:hypothetical protein